MNTNSMNWITEATDTATAIANQIQSWPSAVLLGVFLIILGATLKVMKMFPNKFIPPALMVVGAMLNLLIGDPGKVDPSQRYPDVILGLQGWVVAFASCLVHALVLKRFEKHIPLLAGKTGDTVPPFKPEE